MNVASSLHVLLQLMLHAVDLIQFQMVLLCSFILLVFLYVLCACVLIFD